MGSPMVFKITIRATKLAEGTPATPIEEIKARTTIENCAIKFSSIP